jgi:comEA protein
MFRTLLPLVAAVMFAGGSHAPLFAQASHPTRSVAKPPVAGLININTASATELEALPGIGAKTAARIVEYRQKNGPFKKIEELMNVRGVGEKNFLKLKGQISVSGAKSDHAQ